MRFRVCETSLSPGQVRAALHGEDTVVMAVHPPPEQCNVCFDVRMTRELTLTSSSSDIAPVLFLPSSTSPTLAEQNNSQKLQSAQQLRLTASVRRTRAVRLRDGSFYLWTAP